jgi:hypothetical protein
MKIATRAQSEVVVEAMEGSEHITQVSTGEAWELKNEKYKDMTKRAKELFEVLCLMTEGEANILIREVQGGDGFATWQVRKRA